jgi:hypothetical protein
VVVFRATGDGGVWTTDITKAEIVETDTEIAALTARVAADVAAAKVVDTALIEVASVPSGPLPAQLRERIRATGPTITLPKDQPSLGGAATTTGDF